MRRFGRARAQSSALAPGWPLAKSAAIAPPRLARSTTATTTRTPARRRPARDLAAVGQDHHAPGLVVRERSRCASSSARRPRSRRAPCDRAKRTSCTLESSAHGVCHATSGMPASWVRPASSAEQGDAGRRPVGHEARPHAPARRCAARSRDRDLARRRRAAATVAARGRRRRGPARRRGSRRRPGRGPRRARASRERTARRGRCRTARAPRRSSVGASNALARQVEAERAARGRRGAGETRPTRSPRRRSAAKRATRALSAA